MQIPSRSTVPALLCLLAAALVGCDGGGSSGFGAGSGSGGGSGGHLLITEIVVEDTPTEFIEIHNPTGRTIDLTDYYVTDGTDTSAQPTKEYWKIADPTRQADAWTGHASDFLVRFPTGASIAPGEFQVIAFDSVDFSGNVNLWDPPPGPDPTYEMAQDADAVDDMLIPPAGGIGGSAGLTNTDETVVIFHWDGTSPLVQDVDFVVYAEFTSADLIVDKSGETVGGQTYQNETPRGHFVAPHGRTGINWAMRRLDYGEGRETASGGNGITGHDEMNEDFAETWDDRATPTPFDP